MIPAIAHLIFEPPPPRGFTAAGLGLYLVAVGLIAGGASLIFSRLARRMIRDAHPEDHSQADSHPPG